MMAQLGTVYAMAFLAAVFAAAGVVAAWLLRPRVPDAVKASTYECGMEAVGTTEVKTNIRFYLYALLFVIFDVEVLYIYPWAVNVRELGGVALAEMLVFLAILVAGLAYAWRKGAMAWD